ncbi:MAG: hypothetical protein RL616_619 [Verrucomicrobiota bacterium]|jgi:hypothetical protein
MKFTPAFHLGLLFALSALTVTARESALRYKFSAGETNIYAVEISVRSESGSEVSTGNVVLVTKQVTTNSAKISVRGGLKTEFKRTPQRGPGMGFYGGYYPGQNANVFPPDCEIELDERGNELRDAGDYVLAVPLGKLVQSLFEPLPTKSGDAETHDTVTVLDDPLWLGPAENFMNVRMNGQPISMNYYYMGNGQRSVLATLALARQATLRVKNPSAETVELHKQVKLESRLQTGNEPRMTATSEGDLTFDRSLGLFTKIESQADVASQTETSSRHAKVSFKARLLTGAELAAALAPPPPPTAPRKLTGADLEKFTADLKSSDIETRRAAMRQLNGAEIETPAAELIDLIAGLALDSDSFVKMTAANFTGNHATTAQVPVLLKLLKDSDWSAKQNATKALGRLKDERAIQPLVDLVARGSNMGAQDVTSALNNFGAAAEKSVLTLLNERNAETQRQACGILQQIGTGESLDALQKLVGDSEQQTSQAAVDAIRAIKQRQ